MGQKINPVGFRLAVQRSETYDYHQPGQGGWKSRWYAKGRDFGKLVVADCRARRHIEAKHAAAQVSRVQIDRDANGAKITVFAARPGMIIGKKGEGTDRLKAELRQMMGLNSVHVEVEQISQPEADAKLIALGIAGQLERRVMFRRAMRRALGSAVRLNVDGVKIMSAGRLNGLEIARTEWYREGRIPLHTLKNDIDYGFAEAKTPMGIVGVKVWISRGERYGPGRRSKLGLGDPNAEESAAPGTESAPAETPAAGTETPAVGTPTETPAAAATETAAPETPETPTTAATPEPSEPSPSPASPAAPEPSPSPKPEPKAKATPAPTPSPEDDDEDEVSAMAPSKPRPSSPSQKEGD